MIKIYTTPTCGICKMVKAKLNVKKIPFEEYNLEDYVEQFNVSAAPVVQLDDGTLLTGAIKINDWINQQ